MTLAELRELLTEWLSEIKQWSPETKQSWDDYILEDEDYRNYLFPNHPDDGDFGLHDDILHVVLFTGEYKYHISTRLPGVDHKEGYLACTASTRKPRAGEVWNRGNDRHDGSLTKETWDQIIRDIVGYELVAKVKARKVVGETPIPSPE